MADLCAAKKYGHEFEYETLLMGGCSIDAYGEPLTEESLEKAKASDAVLLGAVGGNVGNSRWYQVAPNLRLVFKLMSIFFCYGIQYLFGLSHNLRTNSVSWYQCNLPVILYPFQQQKLSAKSFFFIIMKVQAPFSTCTSLC